MKQKFKVWITLGIRKSRERRDKLLKQYINCADQTLMGNYHKDYKYLRHRIVILICQIRKKHFQNYFDENKSKIQMMWRGIKSIINIQIKTNSQISSILVKEKINTEPKEIVNAFNNYFSTIAFVLQDKVLYRNDKFNNYLSNPIQTSFFISPSSEQGMLLIINGLNQNKTNGPHSIPSGILQMIKSNICFPLV